MTTANALISQTLRKITTVTPGEPIDGTEATDALEALNTMLKSWSASNLMIPYRTLESFTLTSNKASYTIGQSGSPDVNTVRPDYITYVYRRDLNNQDDPLHSMTKNEYNAIADKATPGTPEYYYFDTQYPNAVLYIYPAPQLTETLFIESKKPINQYPTLQTDIDLPGEYEEAIVYLLAKRLAPDYGVSLTPEVAELARNAERFIRRKNVKRVAATFDSALTGPQPFSIDSW